MIIYTKSKTIEHCAKPFEEIEVHVNGSVYTCCPFWNNTVIGNIFYDSVDNIWNSKKAIELRTRILNGDYSLCNKDRCMNFSRENFYTEYETVFEPEMKEFPKIVNFSYDYECNSACIICRDSVKTLSKQRLEELNLKIDSVYIPLLKNAKIVRLNSAGEVFASRHSKLLVKKIIKAYPDIKFEFITNGFCASKKTFNELKIDTKNIKTITISLHASNKKTYGKIVKNGENRFNTIIKNIKYISSLNKNIDFVIRLVFVLTSLNYKDLPGFLEFSEQINNALPLISEYRYNQNSSINKLKEELTITDKNHKEYNELKKILKLPIVMKNKSYLSPIIQQIQEEN